MLMKGESLLDKRMPEKMKFSLLQMKALCIVLRMAGK